MQSMGGPTLGPGRGREDEGRRRSAEPRAVPLEEDEGTLPLVLMSAFLVALTALWLVVYLSRV